MTDDLEDAEPEPAAEELPAEPEPEPELEPQSLVGDGQERVTVLAHTGCAGLSAGQRATIARTGEVEILLADGRLIDIG